MADETTVAGPVEPAETVPAGEPSSTVPDTVESPEQTTQEPVKPDIEMTNFNGFNLPKTIYKAIKDASYGEATRKTVRELQEQGSIKTDEEKANLENYESIVKNLGDVIKPGAEFTKKDFDDLVKRERQAAVESVNVKLTKADKDIEQLKTANVEILNKVISNKKREIIQSHALQLGVKPESIDDFLTVVSSNNKIMIEEDLITARVITNEGEPAFDADGNPRSVSDYISEEIAKRPYFVKTADTAGAGGQYGQSNGSPQSPFTKKSSEAIKVRTPSVQMVQQNQGDARLAGIPT